MKLFWPTSKRFVRLGLEDYKVQNLIRDQHVKRIQRGIQRRKFGQKFHDGLKSRSRSSTFKACLFCREGKCNKEHQTINRVENEMRVLWRCEFEIQRI